MKKFIFIILLGLMLIPGASGKVAAVDTFDMTVLSETATTITYQWPERPGAYGYQFFVNDKSVSHTWDGTRTTVKFSKGGVYDVQELLQGARAQSPKKPTVTITSAPTSPTTATTASISWTSTNATSFTCKLDAGVASACTSPKQYSNLSVGSHSFVVTATGQRGSASASVSWTVASPPACNDSLDNDGDGKVDYPADPGCSSAVDTDETDAPTPPPGAANLYIDTNGGTCVRSSSPTTYNDASACDSFASAYSAAQSGDTILVKTGNYEKQFFAGGFGGSQARGTKTLTFKGETGNSIRQIHIGSPNLTFDGINADARGAQLGGSDGAVFENGGEPFTFKNGSIGNVVDQKGSLVDGAGIVFDNVRFHDVLIRTEGVHTECMFAAVPEAMIVRNSRFENCAVMDIFFVYPNWWSPQPPSYGNVVLENNWFGHPSPGYSLYVGSGDNQTQMYGWKIRNNYVEPGSYGVNIDVSIGANNVFCGNTGNVPSNWTPGC